MAQAVELAISGGHLATASALTLQLVSLAQRAHSATSIAVGRDFAQRIERLTSDPSVLADVKMCRGMISLEAGDAATAERYATELVAHYQSRLSDASDQARPSGVEGESSEKEDVRDDLSHALNLLGFALLGLGRFEDAAKAYQQSLVHQRGGAIAVNLGQTLHQLGNCESNLGRFREAADHYLEAAKVFHFVGMEEYLSNAIGELGYALLDVESAYELEELDQELIEHGLADLIRETERVFDPQRSLDHNACIRVIRKVFGSVALLSLSSNAEYLTSLRASLEERVLSPFADQLRSNMRGKDESFPLSMLDTATWLGLLTHEVEQELAQASDVSRELLGEMLRVVCNAHKWARNTMRLTDWFSILLTRQWGFQGASRERLREFLQNFDDDVIDYFDLSRGGTDEIDNPQSS